MVLLTLLFLCAPLILCSHAVAAIEHMPPYGNTDTVGAHKNNDNNTISIFTGLHKTAQKTRPAQEESSASKDKERCSQVNIV